MTAAPDDLRRASLLLVTLLDGASVRPSVARALKQIRLAEARDAAFGPHALTRELDWRLLLILFVAAAGSFNLAPDVFEMIGFASPAATACCIRHLAGEGFITEEEGGLRLTPAALNRLEQVFSAEER